MQVLEERKHKITEKLSSQYSLNYISLDEYERLVEYSQKIETEKELNILEKIVNSNNPEETKYNKAILENIEKNYFTLLSSRKTSGPLLSGMITNILGDHKIYLNEEDLINDETTLIVSIILGSVIIYVPDNVYVTCNAVPLLSDISIKDNNKNGYGKKLIIKGSVILGDIKIKTKEKGFG